MTEFKTSQVGPLLCLFEVCKHLPTWLLECHTRCLILTIFNCWHYCGGDYHSANVLHHWFCPEKSSHWSKMPSGTKLTQVTVLSHPLETYCGYEQNYAQTSVANILISPVSARRILLGSVLLQRTRETIKPTFSWSVNHLASIYSESKPSVFNWALNKLW